jgi:hypothetical protein
MNFDGVSGAGSRASNLTDGSENTAHPALPRGVAGYGHANPLASQNGRGRFPTARPFVFKATSRYQNR